MKVVSTDGLTKLIQLVKSAFVKVEDVVETSEVTLADVAVSGDYDDLINKPTIPTATSDLTNDSGYITSSALNGYATQTWVGQQGYITGITSGDVTTALGYTPYNSSNPSGYITSSALVPYALSADLANVATSGSYNDLSNKPDLSAKANIDLSNCTKPYITETYVNGTSWYRVYSDGWCEQGGRINIASMQYGSTSVSLLKPFNDTNYTITIGGRNLTLNGNPCFAVGNSVTTNSFTIWMERTTGNNHDNQSYWKTCGYVL